MIPASSRIRAERAGRLGLPMVLGYIGGTLAHLRPLVDAYRRAGERAGHPGALKVAISTHFHAGADPARARAVYPYYHVYLRPKRPGGRGFVVSQAAFDAGTSRQGAIMIGSAGEITDKLLEAVKVLDLDRVYAQVDWGSCAPGGACGCRPCWDRAAPGDLFTGPDGLL